MTNPWLKDNLTQKQALYVAELASGSSNPEIAEKIHVSEHTIRNTLVSAKERVGASSTANLIAMAISKGWIELTSNKIPYTYEPVK